MLERNLVAVARRRATGGQPIALQRIQQGSVHIEDHRIDAVRALQLHVESVSVGQAEVRPEVDGRDQFELIARILGHVRQHHGTGHAMTIARAPGPADRHRV